jgi:parallel beta-helix repeat protein
MTRLRLTVLVLILGAALACDNGPSAPSEPRFQVGPTGNFRTIRDAVGAAQPGDVIQVHAGTYAERVVINKAGIKLRAEQAVLDGQPGGIGGTGIGIHVSNVADVEISGFIVQNFERGIVLEGATNAVIRGNEVRNNTSKTPPPFTFGVTPFEGIVLIASRNNEVRDNFSHDNGHDGLMVTGGSSGNRITNNRFMANGAQTPTSVG